MKNDISGSLTRRKFLIGGSVALMGASAIADALAQSAATTPYVEVETSYGRVRGARANGLVTFKGVPYGGSVSGANRFKPAPPLQPWKGVRDALEFGPPALQQNNRTQPNLSEDCLVLNIWTPAADGRKRPVMFYNHGGGFVIGSAAAPYQDGGNLARAWDVVVVATNHRLGLMGYLYLGELGGEEYAASGNQGLADIRDGMKWVHDNIEGFGGDPNNVMIFGESGGGAKTSCLYAMPSAAPYFNKASIESGPGIRVLPLETAAATTLLVLKQLGLEKSEWRKLLDVPGEKLVDAQLALNQTLPTAPFGGGRRGIAGNAIPGGFGPVCDGRLLPNHPFDPAAPAISGNKPLIVGYNHDELNFFIGQNGTAAAIYGLTNETLQTRLDQEYGANAAVLLAAYRKSRPNASPGELYVAIGTARFAVIGSTLIAERKSAQRGAPVFMYCFAHESQQLIPGTQHIYGAAHAREIVYKFNNVPTSNAATPGQPSVGATSGDFRPDSIRAALNMSELWSTFARTGRPAARGQPAWPPYDTAKRSTMFIDAECQVVDDPSSPERQIWDRIDPA